MQAAALQPGVMVASSASLSIAYPSDESRVAGLTIKKETGGLFAAPSGGFPERDAATQETTETGEVFKASASDESAADRFRRTVSQNV